MAVTLIRIDKNGTKYFKDTTCPKCNGNGYIRGYEFVMNGVCFLCNGTGYHVTTYKEYTPEYEQKLAERRLERQRKKAPEENARFFKRYGFDETGKTWIVDGDTYAIKDKLREAGAKFDPYMGWHFDHATDEYQTFEINIEEICVQNEVGLWQIIPSVKDAKAIIDSKRTSLSDKPSSQFVGSVGEKFEWSLKFVFGASFDTQFGTQYINKFVDGKGNTIVWKTAKFHIFDNNASYDVKGTIKEHSEYRGEKQTVVTRCKVVG